ncbi:MAG TPA: sulfate ABC transporter permease subunit CysT, partial [Polyangiaceae bacterium]|jgi:sulfate transport system permease protein
VLLPLAALVVRSSGGGWDGFLRTIGSPRALASLRFTFGASLIAAAIDGVFGTIVAWVLARYQFPGKRLVDAVIDLPLALPTAVAGIALTAVWAKNGWLGAPLERLGLEVAFTRAGVVVALAFVGLPFMVRAVQPVMETLDPALEEAAATLGATPFQSAFRVVLPSLAPAIRAGFAAAFARALGEYGSVVFISGNMPMRTEISSLLIMTKLEQYDYAGAASLGVVLLGASLALLVLIHRLQPGGAG